MDRARVLFTGCLSAAACSVSPAVSQQQSNPILTPEGAKAEGSGFWTIEATPDSPVPPRTPPKQGKLSIYAQIAGVSNEEAQKRLEQQNAIRPELERLMRTLRTKERGNYTDTELIHRPDWGYLIYFKRNPGATLAKYTKNPRFKPRGARYTENELQRMSQPWLDRFTAERLTTGWGMNARSGRADIDMVVSEDEFRAVAQRRAWGKLPDFLNLKFGDAPVGPELDAGLARGIRIFPQNDRNLGMTNEAAFGGRIMLRDGCFFVIGHDRSEKLAYFAREVGVGLDPEGYLALHRRTVERPHLGRIGEMFTWPGPIQIDETWPMVAKLRERCGTAPLMHVAIPESRAAVKARYGLSDHPVTLPRRTGASKSSAAKPETSLRAPPGPMVSTTPPPVPPPPPPRPGD